MSRSDEQQLCRVCMRRCKSRYITLLDTYPMEEKERYALSYLTIFNECTQLQAQPGADGLPEWLCTSCSRDLQISYEFCCRARDADAKLRSQLETDKQQLQQQGEIKRAATPSEFELPAGSGADGYLKFGTDQLGDACVFDEMAYAKDPLEDTDSEDDTKLLSGLPSFDRCTTPVMIASTDSYDSEDEKPLLQLLQSTAAARTPAIALATSCVLPKTELFDNFKAPKCQDVFNAADNTNIRNLYDDDDEFVLTAEHSEVRATDAAFSPEAQIFPKGRFKCEICAKPYFTAVGLKSHLEVHLPKSITAKKRRVRKKPTKLKPDTEHTSVDSNEHAACLDIVQPASALPNETPTASTEMPKVVPKTRKKQQPKPKKMFPCHVCGKHMISASKLRYHMVMHTGEKDYLCTMCPKAYSTIYALKHHIRTHTGERPYECKFCGDKFLRPTTLKSHQRRHTGERPYGCDICGKRFIQHSSMTTHMRLNHMEKTIKCPHCEKKYARQTDLNTHLLSHTGDKPYPCQLCPSRFVRQANLNKHMNQQHTGKLPVAAVAPVNASQPKRSNVKGMVEQILDTMMEVTTASEEEMENGADTAAWKLLNYNTLSAAVIKNELNVGGSAEFEYDARLGNINLQQTKSATDAFNAYAQDGDLPTQCTGMEQMCDAEDSARRHWADH